MLPPNEWLADAKRLAINGIARVYHGAERRPNMVVRNLPDKYTVYCHHCHEGGVVKKEMVKLSAPTPDVKRNSRDPGLLLPINLDVPVPNVPYKDIIKFLHEKHMSLDIITPLDPYWSNQDQRIVFRTPDQTIGRDLWGKSKAKWYSYTRQALYCRASPSELTDKVVVLTEDFFSAIKGQHYAPDHVVCVAMLGTTLHNDLAVALTTSKSVIVSLDNDAAGIKGAAEVRQKLELLGVPNQVYLPHELGLDPKDEDELWWKNMYATTA